MFQVTGLIREISLMMYVNCICFMVMLSTHIIILRTSSIYTHAAFSRLHKVFLVIW